MSPVGLTPLPISHHHPEERAPCIPCNRLPPCLAGAPTSGSEQVEGHSDGSEVPPAVVPLTMLRQRAAIMFSGATGAVVASGEGEATSASSFGLVRDVVSVVESLPAALFDRYAEHRPCGLLDRYGAYGMLIGDVLGLPLMTWELAEPVGKAAAKLPEKNSGRGEEGEEKVEAQGQGPGTGGCTGA